MTNDEILKLAKECGAEVYAETLWWQHIYPVNDLREHITDGDCWCNPAVDEEDFLVIHNSMDERETYEEGRKPQ